MKKIVILIIAAICVSSAVFAAQPPSVFLKANSSVLAPGSEFEVKIFISSPSPVNALDFELVYDTSALRFSGSSDAGSLIDVWQTKPEETLSGVVSLRGGMVEPFKGDNGLIAILHFRANREGVTEISARKTLIFAADGNGTEVLAVSSPLKIQIQASAPKETIEEPKDITPPELKTIITKAPSGEYLLIFSARDKESGVSKTEARFRNPLGWTEWTEVKNPARLPEGALEAEVRVTNGAGLISTASSNAPQNGSVFVVLLVISSIIIIFVLILLYNRRRKL